MNSNFLSKPLSQFCGSNSTPQQYIFPTIQNLSAGAYISEILDVREVSRDDGTLEAIDFYHKLTDSSGNVINVRFRYYAKELSSLVSSLKQYPKVQTWQDVIGLQEEITVAQKATGIYMRISSRHSLLVTVNSVSTVSPPSTGASATKSSSQSRGALSRLGNKRSNSPTQTPRQALISEDEEDGDDEFDAFLDETDE